MKAVKTEVAHTATPEIWEAKEDAEFSGSRDFPWIVLTTAPCGPCDPNVRASRMSKANAELIVRAVNSYATMLEALEAILHVCDQISDAQKNATPGVDIGGVGTMRAFAARARAAISLATASQKEN